MSKDVALFLEGENGVLELSETVTDSGYTCSLSGAPSPHLWHLTRQSWVSSLGGLKCGIAHEGSGPVLRPGLATSLAPKQQVSDGITGTSHLSVDE